MFYMELGGHVLCSLKFTVPRCVRTARSRGERPSRKKWEQKAPHIRNMMRRSEKHLQDPSFSPWPGNASAKAGQSASRSGGSSPVLHSQLFILTLAEPRPVNVHMELHSQVRQERLLLHRTEQAAPGSRWCHQLQQLKDGESGQLVEPKDGVS